MTTDTGSRITTDLCPLPSCGKKVTGTNDRYRCPDDNTLWSKNPEDDGVKPILGTAAKKKK